MTGSITTGSITTGSITTGSITGLRVTDDAGAAVLHFSGCLDAAGIGALWAGAQRAAAAARGRGLVFDLGEVERCDTAGAALLLAAERAHGGTATLRRAPGEVSALLDRVRDVPPPAAAARLRPRLAHELAGVAGGTGRRLVGAVAELGEAGLVIARLPARRRLLRPAELLAVAETAGMGALPLMAMLGFLTGLIMAFQSSLQLARFGAQLYVANLVAVALFRELGPLFAGFMLAGRTGSAFAAELGTMKVNQELDALRTMDLDPGTLLVLPRAVAAVLVMPALTLVLELFGLAGMALVMHLLGFPLAAVTAQVARTARAGDLIGGLIKSVCFAAAVAAIGCRAGLAAGAGPRAVGQAATSAVVGGIVATVLLDGIFDLLLFRVGL